MLLVVAFHVGWPRGGFVGVDVFFVISGYLITGLLLREVESEGTIRLTSFYARRARRLLPAAMLVLTVVALITTLCAPSLQRSVFETDIAAAATFVVNWRFADRAVDYWAHAMSQSPVLHFWSLSIEEQFYLVWPGFISLLAFIARRGGRSTRGVITAGLAIVTVVSLIWWLAFTGINPVPTFFTTGARLWELGLGSLVELMRPRLMRPRLSGRALAHALALLGIVLIGFAAMSSEATAGWLALCPTLGTALVIAAGAAGERNVVARILSWRPLVWLGGLSYSLYLWHWPVLLVTQEWLKIRGGYGWGATVAAASLLPAWLSHRFVELPYRFSRSLTERPWLAVSLGGNLAFLALATALFLSRDGAASPALDEPAPLGLGAAALGAHPRASTAGIPKSRYVHVAPSPQAAGSDLTRGHAAKCLAFAGTDRPEWCELGDPLGQRHAVLVGDSKIFQYFDLVDATAKGLGLRVSSATKAQCPFSDAVPIDGGVPIAGCAAFNRALLEELRAAPPDLIITSQLANTGVLPNHDSPTSADMVDGLVRFWSDVRSWGTRVIVVLDNPSPNGVGEVDNCLLDARDASRCAFDRERGIAQSGAPAQRAAALQVPGTVLLDLTDYICPRERCAPVIGDVLIYRQTSHITATYARSLLPVFERKLEVALNLSFEGDEAPDDAESDSEH